MSNLFNDCYQPQMGLQPEEFRAAFCSRCRNQECELAIWGKSKWLERISTQVERLLDNPRFANLDDPRFFQIREMPFEDMIHQAYQLEIADRNQDWEIPEIAITDGRVENASAASNDAVEQALRTLRGGDQPKQYLEEVAEEDVPDSNVQEFNSVVLEPQEEIPMDVSEPPKVHPLPQVPTNTPIPSGGRMVGGGPGIVLKGLPPQKEESDPWAIPKNHNPNERKVEAGATIVIGKKDD